jgi:VanZ family protein
MRRLEMLRSVVLICWAGLIFLFTCTESLEQVMYQRVISFKWSLPTNMIEFLYPLPTRLEVPFLTRKMGHALSFFIFSILLYSTFLSKKKMVAISLFYAVATEVLQLFFQRGGRLFDIGFDGIGILVGLLIVRSNMIFNKKSLTRVSQT